MDRGLRLTEAAQATYRSQSSVTRQIQLLEEELGVQLFARRRNKLVGLTPHAKEIVAIARRMTRDAENMHNIGCNAADDDSGTLTIATTNFHAKYVLPPAIRQFIERYPDVRLVLRQGTPSECCELVTSGRSDLAICAELNTPDGLAAMPCYSLYRNVLVPPRHPLTRAKSLTLEALAAHPLITYDEAFSGSWIVSRTFSDKGLNPKIVLTVVDGDVQRSTWAWA